MVPNNGGPGRFCVVIRDHQSLGVPRDPLRGRPLALLRQEAGRCQVDKAGSNHAGDTERSSGDQDV